MCSVCHDVLLLSQPNFRALDETMTKSTKKGKRHLVTEFGQKTFLVKPGWLKSYVLALEIFLNSFNTQVRGEKNSNGKK